MTLFGGTPLITRGAVEIFRHDWSLDSSDAIRELGYTMTPLAEGVTQTLESIPARRARERGAIVSARPRHTRRPRVSGSTSDRCSSRCCCACSTAGRPRRWPRSPRSSSTSLLLPRIGGRRLYRPVDEARGFPPGILLYPLSVLLLTLAFPSRLDIAAAAWGILAFGDGVATLRRTAVA